MNNYKKPCGCKDKKVPCGCEEPLICGCSNKYDLLCSFYSGNPLNPIGIEPGMDGNTVVRMIVEYIDSEISQIQMDPTVIESIGGKIPIYKGLSDGFIHQIKSIQGQPNGGVIVENAQATPNDCNEKGDYINVKIDETWLTNFLNQWILTIDLCPLVANCGQEIQNPTVTNIPISLANRGTKTFTLSDFTSHYVDPQGDPLTSIRLIGNITGYKLNGVAYVSNTEVTAANLASGALTYTGENIDSLYTYDTPYQAKDSQNNWSNIADIIITVAAKQFLSFSTPTLSLIREVSNTKTSSIAFSNGNGQIMPNGYIFVSQGTSGQPGYLRITSTSQVTLNGTGNIPIQVVSIPTSTQSNQTVNYVFDGSNGSINLIYNSNPVTQDIVINIPNRGEHVFTSQEFLNAYFDYDGDSLTEFRAMVPVAGMKLNGLDYIAGTWIPINNATQLSFTGANQNAAYQQITPWQAKDSQGNISSL
jgi:hypothetical protein